MKSPFLLLFFAFLFIYFMIEMSRNSLENEVNFMSHSLVEGETALAKAETLVGGRGFRAWSDPILRDGHGSSGESSVSKKEENVLLVVGREYGRGKEECNGKVTAIELATSWASSRKGNQVIVASLMQTIQEEYVEFAVVRLQVVQETAKDSSFTFLPSKTDVLPGHLGILKLRLCKGQQEDDLSYLFTRRLDSRLFRLYNPATKESIAGPLSTDHHPGRLINFACLHGGGKDDRLVVFTVQYNNKLKGAADGEFDITFSIFSYSKTEKSWSQSILENTRLQGMADNYIEADQLDQLYFLSNPVLALNRDSTLVYFIFRKHIYTVHRRSESDDDYSLYTQNIEQKLYSADFYVDYIQVLEENADMHHSTEKEGDSSLLLLVSEQKRVYLFTLNETLTPTYSSYSSFHQFITGPLSTIYTVLFDSLFLPGNIFLQCLQLLLFPDDIISAFSLADVGFHSIIQSPSPQSPIAAYDFNLLAMWSGTTAISKSTRIKALDFTNSRDDVVLLLESGDLVLLNPSSLGGGVQKSWLTGPFLTFIREKYLLVTVCVLVVALFLANEVKPDGHAQSQALFLGLVYIVLFVMIFGIIFLE